MPILQTARLEVLTFRFALVSLFFSFVYALIFVFIPNHTLFIHSFQNYSLGTTVSLFFSILLGLPNSLTNADLILFIITSLLVGTNIALLLKTLGRLSNQKVRLSVGGGSVLAIVATGCSACGLSILSLFGLSAATFTFLPFHGIELSLIAITLLLFSFFYTLHKLNEVCEIKY